ncbi:uncharacterized protein B0H64DRAFT_324905, partial [Chaetomium fimeti]
PTITMLAPTYANLWFHFYPIGNTPAVSLTQGLPPEKKADILLLACGDPRNILFTAHCDGPRPMDITCCDVESTIIARNITLFALILDDADGQKSGDNWNIFYHLFLDQACNDRLLDQVKKLHALATSLKTWRAGEYGKLIRFCDKETLARVARAWAFYISAAADKQLWMKQTFQNAVNARKRQVGEAQFTYTGLRSATPTGMLAGLDLNNLHQHFWKHGSLHLDVKIRSQATFANPLFASPDPALQDIVTTAQAEFSDWSNTFRRRAQHDLTLRFFCGDAVLFCHTLQHRRVTGSATTAFYYRSRHDTMEPLVLVEDDYKIDGTAPVSFNVIDTSNLLDHSRGLNLLVATSPLLDGDASSSLYTETIVRREAKSDQEHLDNLVGGHLATTSLLLGLFPIEYWTNTASSSVGDEQLADAIGDGHSTTEPEKTNIHSRITWKRPPLGPGARLDPLHMDEGELAALLYQVYVDMFPLERLETFVANLTLGSHQDIPLPSYSRLGFLALVSLVKRRVVTGWDSAMDRLLSHIESKSDLVLGHHYLQELYLYMHLLGLHSVDTFKNFPGFRAMTGSGPTSGSGLAGWQDMPSSICITLKVPRSALEPMTKPPFHHIGTPFVQAVMRSSPRHPLPWENYYAAVQLGFGKLSTNGSRFTNSFAVTIKEDLQGWHGDSPLHVSFRVPSWTLLHEPQTTRVSFAIQHPPTVLEMDSCLFNTTIGDLNNVYITRELPNLTDTIVIPGFTTDTFTPQGQINSGMTTSTTAHTNPQTARITSLTVRTNLIARDLRTSLTNGATVQTTPLSPYVFKVTIGKAPLTFTFPLPVLANTIQTRIARKTGYIELAATIIPNAAAAPSATFTAPLFPPPTTTNTNTNPNTTNPTTTTPTNNPICWTTPYTTLSPSSHPRISTTNPSTTLSFLHMHSIQMLSAREFRLRRNPSAAPPAELARVALKESLHALLLQSSGLESLRGDAGQTRGRGGGGGGGGGGRRGERVFVLRDKTAAATATAGDVLVFVGDMRLDLARRADGYGRGGGDGGWGGDAVVEGGAPRVGGALSWWDGVWRAPVSVEMGEEVVCGCGKGVFPEGWGADLPMWGMFEKHCVRAAISPLFPSALAEDVIPRIQDIASAPGDEHLEEEEEGRNNGVSGCRNCGEEKSKNGEDLKSCAKCLKVKYCGRACQRADWKRHKKECTPKK